MAFMCTGCLLLLYFLLLDFLKTVPFPSVLALKLDILQEHVHG